MEPVIGIIQSVEDDTDFNGKPYKKIMVNGIMYRVKQGRDGVLMAKWGLLVVGVAIKLIMRPFTKTNGEVVAVVQDIETVAGALPPPTTVAPPPQPAPVTPPPAPRPQRTETNGQALGMMTKEIGDMIRADKLEIVFGADNAILILKWYRGQVSFITGLNVEGVSQ